jgi:adenosylhomocysteine nucleosidase
MATAETTRTVAAVAAMRAEFAGLLRHASGERRLDWGLDYACAAEIAGAHWLLLADGMGVERAGRAAQVALAQAQPAALISTGWCGALDPALAAGDVVVASEVHDHAGGERFTPAQPATRRTCVHGAIECCARVAVNVAEKAALRDGGAVAVEMEAAGVARAAAERSVPFYCVRAVSDIASAALPLDFNGLRNAQGQVSPWRVAAAVLRRPAAVAGLLRLRRDSRRAAQNLGDFLADCRF